MKSVSGILIMFISMSFSIGYTQQGEWIEVRDMETWSSIGFELDLNKKWSFSLEEQLRMKSNSTEVDSYFTEFGLFYTGFEHFEVGGNLRYQSINDNKGKIQGYETHFRYNLDLAYSHKVERFKLTYRVRYQNRNEVGVDELAGDYAISKWRLKASVNYNIRKWKFDPTFSAEIFRRSQETTTSEFNRLRMTLGTKYDLKKFGDIKGFYRIERELNATYPKTTHIWGLAYVYTLKIRTNEN
jgi:hypothetical protein